MRPPILITGYSDPDIDGVAGALAYAEFLNKTGTAAEVGLPAESLVDAGLPAGALAEAGIFGTAHDEAQYVSQTYHAPLPPKLANCDGYESVVLVDASDIAGLEGHIPPEKVVEIIDHRKIHEAEKFPNAAKIQIELVGAAATLIAEKFINANIDISRESAVFLYAAIVSNTLNFKGGVTTPRDHAAAAWLKNRLAIPEDFAVSLFRAKSRLEGDRLAARMHNEIALFEFAGRRLGAVQIEAVEVEKIAARKTELLEILKALKTEFARDFIYLSVIDLENSRTLFFAEDRVMQKTLESAVGISFTIAKPNSPASSCANKPFHLLRTVWKPTRIDASPRFL